MGTSGVPEVESGVKIGFTDFSEFTVAAGLPAGITEFGIGTSSPSAVEIVNDAEEGNYFKMTGHAAAGYGFGLDAFDDQMIFGEMLVRVYNTAVVFNWSNNGPAWNLDGLVGEPSSDINWIGGMFQHQNSGPYQTQGIHVTNGSTGVPVTGLMQEVVQVPEWAWLRIRRTENVGTPSEDDWKITTWFGDIDDEPATPDAEIDNLTAARRILGAMGWACGLAVATTEQRIAYLAFSDDPDMVPPPVPFVEPIPPGTSGVPETIGGVNFGFTDFSEFVTGAGLPSGITAFGVGVDDPSAVAITSDPDEGNYFEMTGQTSFVSWAFGLDSFFGEAEFGEMLARIFFNLPRNNRSNIGPVFSLQGALVADLDYTGGRVGEDISNVVRVQGAHSIGGVGGVPGPNAITADQPAQNQTWMWLRIRRVQGVGDPAKDDWQVTAWYGDIDDEPSSIDGFSFDSNVSPRGLLAMGWGTVTVASEEEQRIAYLSFSSDPLIIPPPEPVDTSGFPEVPKPMRVSALWSAGALRDRSPSGLIQTRSTKAAGWMFTMTYPLLSVRNFDHQRLTTFLYTAWQRGQIFTVKHPLQPGSGLRPNGLGTATVEINGGGQVIGSDSILTDGWPNSTANVARAGDAIKIDGDDGVYILSATASSDGSGEATLEITPPLRIVPADDALVQTTDVLFRVAINERSNLEVSRLPLNAQGPSITLLEALN